MNRRTPLRASAEKQQAFIDRGRRSSAESLQRSAREAAQRQKPPQRAISPASPAQRERVRQIGFCVGCGLAPSSYLKLEPAHLWPRGRGACDDELCVVPLCVRKFGGGCHVRYDAGTLDLLPSLIDRWELCRPMVQHALEHAFPVELLERLANARIVWTPTRGGVA